MKKIKKNLLLLLSFIICTNFVFSQEEKTSKNMLRLELGPTISSAYFNTNLYRYNQHFKPYVGFDFNLIYQRKINNILNIGTGIGNSVKTYRYLEAIYEDDMIYKSMFLEIPVFVHINFIKKDTKIKPYTEIGLTTQYNYHVAIISKSSKSSEFTSIKRSENYLFNVAPTLAFGMDIKINKHLNMGLQIISKTSVAQRYNVNHFSTGLNYLCSYNF